MSTEDRTADAAYYLFTQLMGRGIDAARERVRTLALANPAHVDEILRTNRLPDLDEGGYGFLGSTLMGVLADVLLTMPMGQWELFYAGYAEWCRRQPRCGYRGREEENARGVMLLALKHRCEELQRRVDQHDNPIS